MNLKTDTTEIQAPRLRTTRTGRYYAIIGGKTRRNPKTNEIYIKGGKTRRVSREQARTIQKRFVASHDYYLRIKHLQQQEAGQGFTFREIKHIYSVAEHKEKRQKIFGKYATRWEVYESFGFEGDTPTGVYRNRRGESLFF